MIVLLCSGTVLNAECILGKKIWFLPFLFFYFYGRNRQWISKWIYVVVIVVAAQWCPALCDPTDYSPPGYQLHCCCLGDLMEKGAWQDTVHGTAKCRTWLKWLSSPHTCLLAIEICTQIVFQWLKLTVQTLNYSIFI